MVVTVDIPPLALSSSDVGLTGVADDGSILGDKGIWVPTQSLPQTKKLVKAHEYT